MDKPIFDGMMHSGKPDLEALFRVGKITMVTRAFVPNYAALWPDEYGLPLAEWYDAVLPLVPAPRGIVLIDHEKWSYGTQAERQATAAHYLTLYQEIKSRRPAWRIGWYGDPIRRSFWDSIKDRNTNEYRTWQAQNTDLGAVMAPYTDVYMPSLYFFYTRDTASDTCDYVGRYIEEHIRETTRIRRVYGQLESPIYPYIWWRKHDDTRDLDPDVWETIVRTVLEHADGLVLWGGFQQTWSETAPWWVTIKARLTDKRRTG